MGISDKPEQWRASVTEALKGAEWQKSSRSGPYSDNCVEIAFVDGAVAMRDSKNPTGPVLLFTGDEWEAFVDGVKDREFDVQ